MSEKSLHLALKYESFSDIKRMEAHDDIAQECMDVIMTDQKQIEEASNKSISLPELEQKHNETKKRYDELTKTLEDDKKQLEELQHTIERKQKIQNIIGNILQAQEKMIENVTKRMNKYFFPLIPTNLRLKIRLSTSLLSSLFH